MMRHSIISNGVQELQEFRSSGDSETTLSERRIISMQACGWRRGGPDTVDWSTFSF